MSTCPLNFGGTSLTPLSAFLYLGAATCRPSQEDEVGESPFFLLRNLNLNLTSSFQQVLCHPLLHASELYKSSHYLWKRMDTRLYTYVCKIHNLLRLWLRGRHAKDDYELSASSSSARVIASTGKRKSRSRADRREREQPQAKEGRKAYRYSTHFCSTLITSRAFPSLILFSRTSRLMLDDAACQLRGRHAHHARRQRTR